MACGEAYTFWLGGRLCFLGYGLEGPCCKRVVVSAYLPVQLMCFARFTAYSRKQAHTGKGKKTLALAAVNF